MPWEAVIGLEIHAQLATRTKIFCACTAAAGEPPNTRLCPVCLGLPGALPVLNERAVDDGVLAALALGCRVNPVSVFARKNYFYPDLPKGYQISQFDQPLAEHGRFEWTTGDVTRVVRIRRVHLEEDAGKSVHQVGGPTYVDFNRSGIPLIEIVTEPDLRSADDAAAFFERLRALLVEIGVNQGNLEEGHLRCDANVSIRGVGDTSLGTPVEVKNLNSFRYLQRALDHEIERQSALLSAGGSVRKETRLFDVAGGRTIAMRGKEEAHDYRYFPEPDLPPLRVDRARVERLRARLPELPEARLRRLMSEHGLSEYDAAQIAATSGTTAYFEAMRAAGAPAKSAANWLTGEMTRLLKETGGSIGDAPVAPASLAGLLRLVADGVISGTVAKDVLAVMWATSRPAEAIVREQGLAQIGDRDALDALVRDVVERNPKAVAQFRAGKTLTLGFLVGQVMKATGGKANPAMVNELMKRALEQA
jgi:aspartyl-tRNA(Asn)/glutamyl-tRNA(Gln) amidotransferase subunit B